MKLLNRIRTRVSLAQTMSYHTALGRITMYDSIYVSALPRGAAAYAGYISGNWPTYPTLVNDFKNAKLLSIDPFATSALCHCLDVETGDATNDDILPWFREMKAKGVPVPVVYTSASNVQNVIDILMGAGYSRQEFLIWSAHYTYRNHICAPGVCGNPAADATQWSDAGPNNCDVSAVVSYFFPWTLGTTTSKPPTTTPAPKPTTPAPVEDDDPMPVAIPPKSATPNNVGVSFDGAPYKTIGFLADPGFLGGGTVQVRLAFHVNDGFAVQTAVMNPQAPKAVVNVPAGADGVSFSREDSLDMTLYPNFA